MFDGSNYEFWKKRMRVYLMYFGADGWKYVIYGRKDDPRNTYVISFTMSGLSK